MVTKIENDYAEWWLRWEMTMKNGDYDGKWLWRMVTKIGNDYEEWWLRWEMTMKNGD